MVRAFLSVCLLLVALSYGNAAEWRLRHVDEPSSIVEPAKKAPDGLPDGEVATAENSQDIIAAWYTKPTDRYAHGILGDAIEAGALMVDLADGSAAIYTLPKNLVFEDRTPRLFDLGGVGKTNVITILTDVKLGASVAVFGIEDGALKLIAQTPHIGRSNRWRNIAGIADFDGDGKIQIAEVVTPHIGGTLNFWTWDKGNLKLSGELYGFSNHVIGSREQGLSAAEDFDYDGVIDLALPSDDRKKLKVVSFSGRANKKKTLNTIGSIPLPAPISVKISTFTEDKKPVVQIGLEDESFWEIRN